MRPLETLYEVWRIVEMRNGAVFKTEKVKEVWIPLNVDPTGKRDIAIREGGDMLVPPSSHYKGETIRRRKES